MENNKENEKKVDTTIDEEPAEHSSIRRLTGWYRYVFMGVAVFGALYHIYILNFNPIDPWVFRSTHLIFGLVLGFMLYSGWRTKKGNIPLVDWVLMAISVYIGWYIYTNLEQILFRFGVAPTTMDFIVALAGILLVLELTRRTSGLTLPILALIFIIYVFAGPWLPGFLTHSGYSLERFATYVFSLNGVFGVTTDVSSRYIILFIIFGAFLQKSGVGQYFMDVAFSVAGNRRGGPAKVSLFGSGLMGMINGTSAGNVVATGSLTIPLMKRVGYSPRFSGAVEATASSGGQILPPIMGAGAFLMAEITGIAYGDIIIAATIPALLYFISVYFMIDFQAIKQGLLGVPRRELPRLKYIIQKAYLFIPILILIFMLVSGYSIIRAGTVGIVTCFVLSLFSKETRMGIKHILLALELGMKNAIQIIAIVASAGLIVGVIALTGVGQRFSSLLLSIADQNVFIALLFAMGVSILLGLGMPTTAAYAVSASVIAPGLISLGVEPLIAHMFVFYYAVMSAITPPVALAAFAAAGISGSHPMKTGLSAFQLGLAAYIVPFMFYFSPELLMIDGTVMTVSLAVISALVGVYFLAASVQSWFYKHRADWYTRLALFGAALLFMLAGLVTDIVAVFLVITCIFIQKHKKNNSDKQLAAEA